MAQQVGTLVDAVATRAGVDSAIVDQVLSAHGIPTATVPTARRSLRVTRLRLRGTKAGVPGAGPFDRTFTLPAGVVMGVGPNLRGKTSLLEIITLCLRGTPRDLQLDVAAWLHTVECDAEVNGILLRFRLQITDGRITDATIAELSSDGSADGAELVAGRTLVTAANAEEYAAAVDAFMLDRMGLEPIYAAVSGGGQQRHAWPSYFGALYPPTGGDRVLLGETVMGGLAGRLLMVFLDLPGAALMTRVNTLRETLRAQARTQTAAADPAESRIAELLAQHQEQLDQAQRGLAALPSGPAAPVAELAARVAALGTQVAEADADWRAVEAAHRQSKAARLEDERALNNARETAIVAKLFHGLDPTNCPRCETPVGADRRAGETSDHRCAVCASRLTDDDDATADVLAEREEALAASRAAEAEALLALEDQERRVGALTAELEARERELTDARAAREVGERAALEAVVVRSESALAVLTQAVEPRAVAASDSTLPILDALYAELDERLQAAARGLLATLGQEIAELARRFGMRSVTAVTLNRAARMDITKGGVAAGSFSRQSPGERLRLRIATVIALVRVGTRLGIATHPGLLMIDSLRAEEVQEADAHAVLDALVDMAADTPGMQILTTSQDQTLPTGRLGEEAVLRPVPGTDALW
jgi:hypothetical protein